MSDFPVVPVVQIELFIPYEFVGKLREALNVINVGRIGNYDNCISITNVIGYWRPLDGADPYEGRVGEVTHSHESKVEVHCNWENVGEALAVIREIHPYDEPGINIIPLLNHLFE